MTETSPQALPIPPKRPGLLRRMYAWVLSWSESPYGTAALFVLAFLESSFFPIPPDVLQIALSVARPKRAFFYAFVSMVGSVMGGVLGWYIGYVMWDEIGPWFLAHVPGFSQEIFDTVARKYQEHAFLAIFTAAFTPIPYKVFTVAAGVFHISIPLLVGASFLGRGGRFFLVGSLIYFFGPKVKEFLDKYFELATLALCAVAVAGFAAIKYLS